MATSFEKSIKGATKIKLAPPKSKYVEHILQSTRAGEAGIAEVFRVLQLRLRDSTWTTSFKALIVIHLMIRDGEPNVTLSYLSDNPRKIINTSNYTDMQSQGRNIRHYSMYLIERARSFSKAKVDYVGNGAGRLKKLPVDKGLLRETEAVQEQIHALLKCDLLSSEIENEITLFAFRLLTMDLLALFQVMNEGTINVLEHYFEMSRPDAERALGIYKTFSKQTGLVVQFLQIARQYEHSTRVEIPKVKHAPTSLASSLEEYLNDREFETNRSQYMAQQQGKKGVFKPASTAGTPTTASSSKPSGSAPSFPSAPQSNNTSSQPAKGPAPDLIDFFDSIESNQQPLASDSAAFQQQQQQYAPPFQQYPQQTGYGNQNFDNGFQANNFGQQQTDTNPFGQYHQQQQQPTVQPLQTHSTGAGFGGYGPQPQQSPQQQQWPQQQQQQFSGTQSPQNGYGYTQFSPQQQTFNQQPMQQQQQQPQSHEQSFIPQQTGSLQRQATNPFRQSVMPNMTAQNQPPLPTQSPQNTNPFAQPSTATIPENGVAQPVNSQSIPQQQPQSQSYYPSIQTSSQHQQYNSPISAQNSLLLQRTGTNPFAHGPSPFQSPPTPIPSQNTPSPQSQSPFQPSAVSTTPTGSTNPFRQSAFVNQQTGQGWQHGPQSTMGGFENLGTVEVFPRPGQAPQQQQQQQGFGQQRPWG